MVIYRNDKVGCVLWFLSFKKNFFKTLGLGALCASRFVKRRSVFIVGLVASLIGELISESAPRVACLFSVLWTPGHAHGEEKALEDLRAFHRSCAGPPDLVFCFIIFFQF